MNQLEIKNADDLSCNTESEVMLRLRFRHDLVTSSDEAKDLSRQALIDYCEAYNLDIYKRAENQVSAGIVDENKVVPALEAYLLGHLLTVVASHRGAKAEREARTTVAATLNAN